MAGRLTNPVGIPIARSLALVGPLLRRLLRWWLIWLVFVIVVWALMPSLLRFVDVAFDDGSPNRSSALPIDRPGDGARRTSSWCLTPDAATKDDLDLLGRDIDIDLRGGATSASLAASFGVCGARLEQVIETLSRADAADAEARDRVAGMVFGYVDLGGGRRQSAPLRLEATRGTSTATVRGAFVEAAPVASTSAPAQQLMVTPSAWTAATTHVRIRFDAGTGVWSSGAPPARQEDGSIEWELKGSDAFVSIAFEPPAAARPAAASAPSGASPVREPGPLLLRLLSGHVRGLRSVWLGITLAVPFLLLGVWASRASSATTSSPADGELPGAMREGCILAGGLIALLAMLELAESVAADLEWWPNQIQLWNLAWTASVGKTALIVSMLIAFGTWKAAPRGGRGAMPLAAFGLAVAVGGWLFDPANLEIVTRHSRFAPWASLNAGIALCIEVVGALLVGAAIGVESVRWGVAARAAFVLVVAVLVVAIADHVQTVRSHLSLLSVVFALPFGWAFASASRVWIPGAPRPPRWTLLIGALVAALLALPPDQERRWSQAWLVGSTAWALVRWWQLPALALLVAWFARASASSDDRTAPVIEAAAVFLFVLFFWNAQLAVFPLVVQAVAGAAVLRWAIFAGRPLPAPTRRRRLVSKTVDDLRDINALARLRRVVAKALNDKLAKGELDAEAWLDRKDRDDRVIRRRAAAVARGKLRAMLALNVGPRGPAWQRGAQGAVVTTVLALPWLAAFLVHTTFETRYATNAGTLSQLGILVFDLLRWPALGFFFLYFYPAIRGVNGIQKGLMLAGCLIVPSAAAALCSTTASNGTWTAFALWSLQIFICCMSVGVGLGDLGALRKVGKGPRALIEIYDLGTLMAWFTSIAIAVGAAATTAIASGAGAFLTVGLKLLIPEAPTGSGAPH